MSDQKTNHSTSQESSNDSEHETSVFMRYAKFIIPSLIGIGLFLTPITHDGKQTIVIGLLSSSLMAYLGHALALFGAFTFSVSGLGSLYASLIKPKWLEAHPLLSEVFITTPVWLVLRVLGGILCTMTVFQVGPEWIIGADTGGVAYIDIAGIIFCIIFVANFLLPFLTDFGFFEFIGTIITRPFKFLFGLPGRASLDALTSWVGDSSIGTILTIRQYEQGSYSAREAAVVATNFSAVSLPFTVVIAQIAQVDDKFLLFYATVSFCGIVAALITPRVAPLSRVPDSFYQRDQRLVTPVDSHKSLIPTAIEAATKKAAVAPSLRSMLTLAGRSVFDIFIAVMPAAMTIEFLVLVVYYHTEVLQILSFPMVYVLQLLQIPEAEAAAAGTLVGFFDQFIPTIVSTNIESPITRFVLAGLSVTQLIYMAENGLLVLRSSIPIGFKQLAMIFLVRTAIVLPLLSIAAHMIY
ncbi:MAG: nucleoside recognition membrane protein YjiH [Cryomorphaceae bacterium]|jgi:nucleoside recognition membrane protein YjiH